MGRKAVIFIMMTAVLLAVVPVRSAQAESDQVLLIYRDKTEMTALSNLILACGMQVNAVDIVDVRIGDCWRNYDYIVLQDDTPLRGRAGTRTNAWYASGMLFKRYQVYRTKNYSSHHASGAKRI